MNRLNTLFYAPFYGRRACRRNWPFIGTLWKNVAAGAVLFCLFSLLLGCSSPNSESADNGGNGSAQESSSLSTDEKVPITQNAENLSENNSSSSVTGESVSALDNGPASLSAELPTDLLGAATDNFIDTVTGGDVQEAPKRDWDVPEDVREKYTSHADILFSPSLDSDSAALSADEPRYTFRYHFEPGTEQKWNVSHQLYKETTYGGMTRRIETVSKIVRSWKVGNLENGEQGENGEYGDDALFPIEYRIDQMKLSQQEEGEAAVSYDSRTDSVVPEEFRRFGTEKMIGVPLERFRIDQFGRMTEKAITVEGFESDTQDSRVTVPFPAEPVAVGQSWTIPCTFYLKAKDSTVRTVKGIQRFRLENVTGDLATIRISMTILSMVGDPYLEGQLAEKLCEGVCRFDRVRGEAVRTELEFSRTVPNAFGEATILVYRCRIIEELDRSGE